MSIRIGVCRKEEEGHLPPEPLFAAGSKQDKKLTTSTRSREESERVGTGESGEGSGERGEGRIVYL